MLWLEHHFRFQISNLSAKMVDFFRTCSTRKIRSFWSKRVQQGSSWALKAGFKKLLTSGITSTIRSSVNSALHPSIRNSKATLNSSIDFKMRLLILYFAVCCIRNATCFFLPAIRLRQRSLVISAESVPTSVEAARELEQSNDREVTKPAAISVSPPKKKYFYQRPVPADVTANGTSDGGAISYPCISERYRQSLEKNRP